MALHVADSEVDEDATQTTEITRHPDNVVVQSKGCADDGFIEVPPAAGTSNLAEELRSEEHTSELQSRP